MATPHTTRFTYRFVKDGRAAEVHSESLEDLQRRAAEHLELGQVLPVHIRQNGLIVLDIRDITDAWEARYLSDDPPPAILPALTVGLLRRRANSSRP